MESTSTSTTSSSLWRVEVTLESLQGLLWINHPSNDNGNDDDDYDVWKNVSAHVTFSGSVPRMQVTSCRICSHTGQLMIESESLRPSSSSTSSPPGEEHRNDGLSWLQAKFASPLSSCHLTVPLPERDRAQQLLRLRNAKLAEINRDCRVVKEDGGDDDNDEEEEDDSNNHTTCPSISSAELKMLQHDVRRGPSAVWSSDHSSSVFPEIVALEVRLVSTSSSKQFQVQQQVGIAHLVVFSNEQERGSYMMELPIKQPQDEDGVDEDQITPASHSSSSSYSQRVVFTARSRLRLQVKLLPPQQPPGGRSSLSTSLRQRRSSSSCDTVTAATTPPPSLAATRNSSRNSSRSATDDGRSSPVIQFTRSQLVDQVGPLLEKIRQSEQEAMDYRKAQKRAMDVAIHQNNNDAHGGGPGRSPPVAEGFFACGSPAPAFGSFSWMRMFQNISTAVRRCEVNDHASVDSSIRTHDSWEI